MFEAERGVVLSMGTSAAIPPIEGLAGTPYWTNRDAVETATLPRSLLVLGGGAVGLELAQVFARFGVDVTVIEALNRLLAVEEPESSALAADGVTVITGATARRVNHAGDGFTVTLAIGETRAAQRLLVAPDGDPT